MAQLRVLLLLAARTTYLLARTQEASEQPASTI